jgi:hypothetical protein
MWVCPYVSTFLGQELVSQSNATIPWYSSVLVVNSGRSSKNSFRGRNSTHEDIDNIDYTNMISQELHNTNMNAVPSRYCAHITAVVASVPADSKGSSCPSRCSTSPAAGTPRARCIYCSPDECGTSLRRSIENTKHLGDVGGCLIANKLRINDMHKKCTSVEQERYLSCHR